MYKLRYRQIHLDFHTSEKIPGIGSRFDKQQWQEALQIGHIDSITIFSKCHHGLSYHDTDIGVRHPHMDEELLPRQIEACREIDVNCPVYISAGLDEAMIQRRPEWGVVGKGGKVFNPLAAGFKRLCFNTPYLDYLCAQIEEVVNRFDTNGIFLDIIGAVPCYCKWCMESMAKEGIDSENDDQVRQFSFKVLENYYQRTTAACRVKDPDLPVFHNSGHIYKGLALQAQYGSHLELESLPTGGWGYDHFPLSAKYAGNTEYDVLGMTGKFQTTWGEFGGFKRPVALKYECAAMVAFGSKCSVGDQLHPNGEMNADTYNLIGAAYDHVEQCEPWCADAQQIAEIAIVSHEANQHLSGQSLTRQSIPDEGAGRMLLEAHALFTLIDESMDFSPYKLLIFPDEIAFSEELTAKVQAYIAAGGKVILSGDSGLNAERTGFAIDAGLELVGKSEWQPDYIVAGSQLKRVPVQGPFVVYTGAWDVKPIAAEPLASRRQPYFNRRFDHFCSHQHTPDAEDSPYPAATSNGSVVYFAHKLFTDYRQLGQPLYRDLIEDAIELLIGSHMVTTSLPTGGRLTLTHQPDQSRYILHLLYAALSKRGADVASAQHVRPAEIIEDEIPLHDIHCEVEVGQQEVKSVVLEPQGDSLEFTQENDRVTFTVPQLRSHQMVEIAC
jgi:hypothetical protein